MNTYNIDGIEIQAPSYETAVRIARIPQHVIDEAIERAFAAFDYAMACEKLPAPPALPLDMMPTMHPPAR